MDDRIRAATAGDARALSELMHDVYAEERWFVGDAPPRPDALARRLRGLDPASEIFLLAETSAGPRSGWCPVGWIEAYRYVPTRMRHVASFTLAVDRKVRGRGIGRTLLRSLEPWALRVGVRKLRLDVRAGNVAARRLYESEGFEVEGTERAQIRLGPDAGDGAAEYEDNVIMARFL